MSRIKLSRVTTARRDTTAARRATSQDERRAEIVRAAAAAIEELGPDVATGQIAEHAGLPRPHVYRHFASKSDLDREIVRYASYALNSRVRATLTGSGTPLELIGAPIRAMVDWADANPNLFRFLVRSTPEHAEHPRSGGAFVLELTEVARRYLIMFGADPSPAERVMVGLLGMINATVTWWLDHREQPADELSAQITQQSWLLLDQMARDLGIEVDPNATVTAPPA